MFTGKEHREDDDQTGTLRTTLKELRWLLRLYLHHIYMVMVATNENATQAQTAY